MPYVDESLLPHNMPSENGIQTFWEDKEQRKHDLRVAESGLLTRFKNESFQEHFEKSMESVLEAPAQCAPKLVRQSEIVSYTLLMLQGIPSQMFDLE